MHTETSGDRSVPPGEDIGGLKRRRRSIRRSVLVLAVTTAALAVFTLGLGDVRRKRNVMDQACAHVEVLQQRVTEGGRLPLNLALPQGPQHGVYAVSWLSREDARLLRDSQQRVIVAETTQVHQSMGRDGRMSIYFENGRFDCEWLTVEAFAERLAAQQEVIRRLGAGAEPRRTAPP